MNGWKYVNTCNFVLISKEDFVITVHMWESVRHFKNLIYTFFYQPQSKINFSFSNLLFVHEHQTVPKPVGMDPALWHLLAICRNKDKFGIIFYLVGIK